MRNNKSGISLVTLIITIVVIIVLAAIVLFTGLSTPDQATFARFTSEYSDISLKVSEDYMEKYTDSVVNNNRRTKAQIYYEMASGIDVGEKGKPQSSGEVGELNKKLSLSEGLKGEEYYHITVNTKIEGWDTDKYYFEPEEKHYITDEGELFVLPGYLVENNGVKQWWINETKYYTGDQVRGEQNPGGEGSGTAQELCRVNYVPNGGTGSMSEQIVVKDTEITLPSNRFTAPSGKVFAGWDVNGTVMHPGDKLTITESYTTIRAQWSDVAPDEYIITIEANNGTGSTETEKVTAGESFTLPASNKFSPAEGKEFDYWSVDGTQKDPGDIITINKDTRITAIWKSAKCTVEFNGNTGTGTMASESVSYGSTYYLPTNGFTAPAYTKFAHWEVNGESKAPGAGIIVKGFTTVTAIWEAEKYTLTFVANNGTNTETQVTANGGENYTLPTCEFTAPKNQTFSGWNVNGELKAANSTIRVEGNTTITAIWKAITFTVEGIDSSYQYTGAPITPVPTVKADGTLLVDGQDYEVVYGTNTDVGTKKGTVTISFKGNYEGSKEVTFDITAQQVDAGSITVNNVNSSYDYTGTSIQPVPEVWIGEKKLETSEYTVSYGTNTDKGEGTLVITLTGNYTGVKEVKFTINAKKVEESEITINNVNASYTYKGSAIQPDNITVQVGGSTIPTNSYTVEYGANITAGTNAGSVTVKLSGNYEGTKTITFDITPKPISASDISTNTVNSSYTYTGEEITPITDVIVGTVLTEGTDYDIDYQNNTNVTSKATATITLKGNYTGTKVIEFAITAKQVSANDITTTEVGGGYTYTGEDIEPIEEVKIGDKKLTKGTDYDIVYENNKNATTGGEKAKATITLKGNYKGEKVVEFDIVGKHIDATNITTNAVESSYTFTGDPITPITSVEVENKTLVEGTDYEIVYANNKNATTEITKATATIKLKGNYTGEKVVEFEITPKQVSTENITTNTLEAEYAYTGDPIKPITSVKANGTPLVQLVDYTVTYENNTEVGNGKAKILLINNYAGEKSIGFSIVAKEVTSDTITTNEIASSYTYTGTAIEPITSVSVEGNPLSSDEYEVVYANNVNASTESQKATATITTKGTYEGVKVVEFTIAPKSIEGVTLEVVPGDYTYTGEGITPEVTVTDGSLGKLEENKDYTISGEDNTNAGPAIVTITGIGNYSGTKSTTFTITKAKMEVTAEDFQGTYDGKPHQITLNITTPASGTKVYYSTEEELTDANHVSAGTEEIPTRTDAGNTLVYFYITADNFEPEKGEANIYIEKRNITVKPVDATKPYDGKPLESNTPMLTDGTLAEGHKFGTVSTTGSKTDVGSIENEIETIEILDAENNDVTANYAITPAKGTLTITAQGAANFVIELGAYDDVYDGTEKRPSVTVTVDGEEIDSSNYDYIFTNNVDAGDAENSATVTVTGKPGGNYEGSSASKNFTIKKRPLTVTAKTRTEVYNGTELRDATLIPEGLATGHVLNGYAEGGITNVGTSDNIVKTYAVKSGDADVTRNYVVTPVKGTLEVTARPVTVVPETTELNYTGSALKPTATVSGAVAGETINLNITTTPEEAIEPGTYSATATISDVTGGKAENYTLTGTTTFDFTILAKITFNANDGSESMADVYKAVGSTYELPANGFTAPQYKEFAGWEVNGETKAEGDEITIAGNTTIKATWKFIQYTVTLEANNGTGDTTSTTVNAGSEYELPTCEYTYQGFEFEGWSVNGGTTQAVGTTITITSNTTITAVWKNAKFEVGDLIEDEGIKIGDYVNYTPYTASNTYLTATTGDLDTGSSAQTLTRTENTVWRVIKVDSTKNEVIITPTDAVNTNTNLTLYGGPGYINHKNILNDVSDKLYSNTQLGLTARSMIPEDLDYTISDDTSSAYAYYPKGTSSVPNVTHNGITYTGKAHTSVSTSGYKDYRFWDYVKTDTTVEKTETINGKTYTYGYPTSTSPVLVHRIRYTQTAGANTTAARALIGSSRGWLASSCVDTNTSNSNFYVRNVYSSGMYSSGLAYSTGYANSYSRGVRPVVPLSYAIKLVESDTKVEEGVTYKVWDIDTDIVKHTVSFQSNGGSGAMDSVSVATGSSYSLPVNKFTVEANKVFAGWDVNGEIKSAGDIITVTSDITIKATWKTIEYTVTLTADNGTSETQTAKVNAGENYTLPSNPFTAPVNKKFAGWDVNGETKAVGTQITITANTTVTATWSNVTLEVSGINASYEYTGTQITPAPVVKADGVELTEGEDYDVAYGENKNAGPNVGSVTVTYKEKYEGTETINFTITPKDISSVTMKLDITEYTFDGTAKTPGVTVTDGSLGGLTPVTDYTVAWTNNTNAALSTDENAPTVTITGTNNYTGTKFVTFTIKKANMVVSESDFLDTYDGTAHSATVTVTTPATGATIRYKEGTELTAENYDTVGSTTMPTRTDVGNSQIFYYVVAENYNDYSGSVNTVITQRPVTVKADDVTIKYNGEEHTSTAATPSGLADGHKLGTVKTTGKITDVGSVDNEITSVTILDASNNDVTTNYAITPVKGTLTITPEDAATFTITVGSYDNVYDGTAKTPSVTVKVGTKTVPETEYIVSHSNNVDEGTTATVTVTGKEGGNYEGSEGSQYFTINKRPLTITAGSGTQVYDGTKLEVSNATSEGLVNGHDLTVTTQGSQTNVGSSENTIATYTVMSGEKDVTKNYEMTPVAGTLAVTARTLTVTPGTTTLNYNGSALKPTATVTGAAAGETINLSITTNPVSAVNPGTYSATVTIGSVTGGNASNYTLSGTTTFDFTILAEIAFAANGGSGTMDTLYQALNSTYELPEPEFTYGGYNFTGWDVNGTAYAAGASITITGNTTITAQWKKIPTFADIKIGDYVSYTGDGSYYVDDSITGATEALCSDWGYTYQGGTTLTAESATWRVWDIEEDGTVIIMPTAPVSKINLGGSAGYINAEKVLDGVSQIYTNSSLGVTEEDVESLRIEDLEERSTTLVTTRDSYQATSTSYPAYGETNYEQYGTYYTSGTFYGKYNASTGKNEILSTPITASSSNKVELLQTYYYASNPTWKTVSDSNFSGLTYGDLLGTTYGWLASPCVYLDSSYADFNVHRARSSYVNAGSLYNSYGNERCRSSGVRPLVSLGSELQIEDGDGLTYGTAWVLKSNATKYTVSFDSNEGTGTMASKQAVANYELTLPHCEFTAPSGKAFIGWEVNGEKKAKGDIVTITADTVIKALWGRPIGGVLQIGDYVDYISDEAVDSTVAWRVWDKDANGNIIITPSTPVGYMMVYAEDYDVHGPALYKTLVNTIEAESDKYTSAALGVTADDIRSMKTSDVEDTRVSNLADSKNQNSSGLTYGTIATFTSGTFHMKYDEATGKNVHLESPIEATASAPVKLMQTNYYAYSYTWNSLNNPSFSQETYGDIISPDFGWLATESVDCVVDDVGFYIDRISQEMFFPLIVYSETFGEALDGGFRPLITLNKDLEIDTGDGASADTAWVIKNNATRYTITFDANTGTGTMAELTAVGGREYTLPECKFTAPDGSSFAGWDVNGTTYEAGASITITGNTILTAQWKEPPTVGSLITSSGIQIGDYVNYTPYTASNTYVTATTGDLDTGSSAQTLTRTENTVWRVIKVDSAKNEVIITPTDAVNTDTNLTLYGGPGYINHKNILNDVSDKLYSNTQLGLTARSMIPEDLDYTISDDTSSAYAYYPNGTSSVPNVTYNGITYTGKAHTSVSTSGYKDYRFWEYVKTDTTVEKTETINGKTYTYAYPTASSPVLVHDIRYAATAGANTTAARALIGSSYGWLASSFVSTYTSNSYFYVRSVNSSGVNYYGLARSNGYANSLSRGVRPVVPLSSTLQLSEAGTQVDGSTTYKVWDISGTFKDTETNKIVNVVEDANITNTAQKTSENVAFVLQAENETTQVPVPAGFNYVLGTGDTGLVVKDASDNEFVWIPVNLTAAEETAYPDRSLISDMYGTGTYTLAGSTGVTTTKYGKSNVRKSDGTLMYTNWTTPGTTLSYREPDLVTYFDTNSTYLSLAGFSTATELANDLVTEFNSMITSVEKYGGFYVGRYELGYSNGVVCKPGVTALTAATSSGTNYYGSSTTCRWYGLYKASKTFTQGGVTSNMIWGTQWDAMVNFIGDHTATAPGTKYLTGASQYNDKYKNVYDTSTGAVYEFTATAYGTNGRGILAGYCLGAYPASYLDYGNANITSTYGGTRVQLYIKN